MVTAIQKGILTADATGDRDAKYVAQLKLKEKEAKLKQFLKDTGRMQHSERQQVMGFGHS
ncbi:MAG: hypothetical protein ACOX8Q_03575 [Christensenellales bacterium]|jgi:hypothetical protein